MASILSTALQTLKSHTSDVTCCDFGKNFTLITGSSDKSVRAWEWVAGKGYTQLAFAPIANHTYGVTDARFSPQGTMLATSSIDGSTVLWNIRTSTRIHTFVQPNGNAVRVCRFTPDSTQLVTAGDDGSICVWNLAHRSLVRTMRGHDQETVQALAVSPTSTLVASGCSQGTLILWDLEGNQLATQDAAHDLGVTGADFSPAPQTSLGSQLLLASCGHDHAVRLWRVRVGKVGAQLEALSALQGHSSTVLCVRFAPVGDMLASGGLDKTLRVWQPSSGKCIKILEGHSRYVACCAFSRDGSLIASGSNDKSAKIWDLSGRIDLGSELVPCGRPVGASGGSEARIAKHAEEEEAGCEARLLQRLECGTAVNGCHFSPGLPPLLAAATGDKNVKVWQMDGARFKEAAYSPIEAHRYSVNQVEVSPDGTLLVSCSLDGAAALWNTKDGQRSSVSLQSSGAGVRTCRFSPDGSWVVTGGDDDKALVWSLPSGAIHSTVPDHTEAVTGAAFSPDSRVLASGDLDGTIRFWCLKTLRNLAYVKSAHDMGTQSCDFSPCEGALKGERYLLASGGNDSMVRLWWLETSAPARVSQSRCLEAHGGNVTSVRFAPSGQLLASAASDKTARVWNVYQGDCLFVLETHSSIVTCVSFSKDGALLATGSLDKCLIVWELPKEILFRSLAEERLRDHRPRLEAWGSKDVSLWLQWAALPSVPHAQLEHLVGADLENVSAPDLAQQLSLVEDEHVEELGRQLFWLRRQEANCGRWEELLPPGGVPHELLCPITQVLFREPVLCPDGFTYERAAIDEWFLSGKCTSPMTNLPLSEASYVPNITLRAQVCSLLFGEP